MSDASEVGNYFVPHPGRMRVSFFPITEVTDYVWSAFVAAAFYGLGLLWGDFSSIAWVLGAGFWVATMWPMIPSKDERLYYLALVAPVVELRYIFRRGKVWVKGQKERYPYQVHVIGPMGLIYHIFNRTYSMVFITQGSLISTLNLVAQRGQNGQMAQIIRRASASTGLKGLKINFGFDMRPEDPFAVRYMLAAMGNVNVILPDVLDKGVPERDYTRKERRLVKLRGVANEMEDMALAAAKVTMSITVTVKDNGKFQKILREGYAYNQDMSRQTLVQVRDTLAALLKTVWEDPRMLDGREAEEYSRTRWDIAKSQTFYTQQMLQRAEEEERQMELKRTGGLNALEQNAGVSSLQKQSQHFHSPEEYITAHADCLAMDGTYATTIKLTEMSLDQPPVDYIRDYSGIFNTPALFFSIDVMGQTKKGSIQYFGKDAQNSVKSVARQMAGAEKTGIAAEEAAQQEYEEMRRLRASYTIDFIPSITVLADNRDIMEQWAMATVAQNTEMQFGPARVTGRFRQVREVLPSLMHIPG